VLDRPDISIIDRFCGFAVGQLSFAFAHVFEKFVGLRGSGEQNVACRSSIVLMMRRSCFGRRYGCDRNDHFLENLVLCSGRDIRAWLCCMPSFSPDRFVLLHDQPFCLAISISSRARNTAAGGAKLAGGTVEFLRKIIVCSDALRRFNRHRDERAVIIPRPLCGRPL